MRVAVLGCGPAGLIAAHAAVMQRHDVIVFSKKRKSQMYGAQYLHRPIAGISEPLNYVTVDYQLRGSVLAYREKVYGKDLNGDQQSSVEALESSHEAWDIREAYDRLWELYGPEVQDTDLSRHIAIDNIIRMADLVISSVPAPVLCLSGHSFQGQQVWAAGEAHDQGITLPYPCPENTVICNGEDAPAWYRLSNVFGVKTVEWPVWVPRPPVGHPAAVVKPLRTNCDCYGSIMRVGRYGRWQKGALSHEAYDLTVQATLGGVQESMF